MAKLLIDERKVVRRGEKLIFKFQQEQEYEKDMDKTLIENWQKEMHEKKSWIKNYPKHLEQAQKQVEKELIAMKDKMETDLKNIEEGIKIWSNIGEEDYTTQQPIKG